MTGETGDHHATLRSLKEESTQRSPDRSLGGREARLLGVGGVGQQERDAFVTERREARDVGASPVDRREVEFEVTRVHDDAGVGAKGQGVGTRHRVRDGDELDFEGTDLSLLAVAHLDEGEGLGDLGLSEAMTREAERQRRAVDRDVDVLHQVAQRTRMVLVSVGQHDRVDPIASFDQPTEVRQDQVDPVHRGLREHQTRVDDHDATVLFDRRAVSPNFTQTAEEGDANGVFSHAMPGGRPRSWPRPRRECRHSPNAGVGTGPRQIRGSASRPWRAWGSDRRRWIRRRSSERVAR